MLIQCRRCHRKVFVFQFESKTLCKSCLTHVSKPNPIRKKPTYGNLKKAPHDARIQKTFKSMKQARRDQVRLRRTASGSLLSALLDPVRDSSPPPPQMMTLDDTASIPEPSVMTLQCMTLFIPFDAGKKFYKDNAKQGTFQGNLVPTGGFNFAPLQNVGGFQPLAAFNTKPYPFHQPLEKKSGFLDEADVLANYDAIVLKHIQEATNVLEWKRLHATRPYDLHKRLTQLVPEVIFLSEELKGAPFPNELRPCPELTYRRIGSIRTLLDPDVDPKNEISAYVLRDEMFSSQVLYEARGLIRQGVNHPEKWLCVQKIVPEYRVYFEVAGVHLDAGYTGHTKEDKKHKALEEVAVFAHDNNVDVLLGDLNMDSFELGGGFFPNRFSFQEGSDGNIHATYTVSHSNTNAKNNYMGGIIVNQEQVDTESINILGEDTRSLSRTLGDSFYSDHPAIMANYVKSFR
ncbi:hypothetical protein ACN47A_09050 [Myxococcus fulvus]|uniref:hypothetical protein n=1 Tax=Myxococcus fulvus TaxID=33 RepID=UPI003B99BAFB